MGVTFNVVLLDYGLRRKNNGQFVLLGSAN